MFLHRDQIVKVLPKMIDKATNRDLSKGLKDHLEETEKQIGRLDLLIKIFEQSAKGVTSPAINKGSLRRPTTWPARSPTSDLLDAAIVGSAQAVKKRCGLPGTAPWSRGPTGCGRDDIVRLFPTNLNEEKAADKKLSTVALRKGVNRKAAS